jgi:hypothetical protein
MSKATRTIRKIEARGASFATIIREHDVNADMNLVAHAAP